MIKKFNCVLVVNYKNGKFKLFKKKAKNLTSVEIPIKFELEIEIPDMPELQVSGKITLSDEKITKLVLEEL